MTALSELIEQSNTRRLSARAISRSAQAAGFSLNHDTAARYLRGDHGRPDEQTLLALHKVLRIPLGQLRAAASLPAEETEPYRPPTESSRLNRRQRRAIDEIIRAMLEPRAAQAEVTDLSRRAARRPNRPTTGSKAARRGPAEPPDA